MDFAFAIRQVSTIRDLYENAQKMEAWLPAVLENLALLMGSEIENPPRYIVLHDTESAYQVNGAAMFPVWNETEAGLIHFCPDVTEWRRLLTGWLGTIPVENGDALKLERYARLWTLRFLTCVMVGQGIAKHHPAMQRIAVYPGTRWMHRGLALYLGRQVWELSEPYLQEEAQESEKFLEDATGQINIPVDGSPGWTFIPEQAWPGHFRLALAARDLAGCVGGTGQLLTALPQALDRSPGEPCWNRIFSEFGMDRAQAGDLIAKWGLAVSAAA